MRWRVIDLCQWLFEEHKVSVAKQTPSRELHQDRLLARSAMIPLRSRKVGGTCCRQNSTKAMTSLGRQVRFRVPLLLVEMPPTGPAVKPPVAASRDLTPLGHDRRPTAHAVHADVPPAALISDVTVATQPLQIRHWCKG